jgi:hypothetical protein
MKSILGDSEIAVPKQAKKILSDQQLGTRVYTKLVMISS